MAEDAHSSNNVLTPCIICGGPVIDNHPGKICTLCLLPAQHTTDNCPHLVVDRFARCEACFKSLGDMPTNEPNAEDISWLAAGRVKW